MTELYPAPRTNAGSVDWPKDHEVVLASSHRSGVVLGALLRLTQHMSRYKPTMLPVVWALVLGGGVCLNPRTGLAETLRFLAQELENSQANWTSQEVVIHRGKDVEGGLLFILENPSARTHAFESPGLLHQIVGENQESLPKPLRISVAPGETVEVPVRIAQVEREPDMPYADGAACYRFYCQLHRGDDDPGGTIRVTP